MLLSLLPFLNIKQSMNTYFVVIFFSARKQWHARIIRRYSVRTMSKNQNPITVIFAARFISGPCAATAAAVLLQFIHCVTVYFNNLHPYSHKAEIGWAWAYLKVQCNPVICRVVRKIHSPLTPIGVLSPLMQLIGIRCYLRNTEQFNTLTPPPPHTHTH